MTAKRNSHSPLKTAITLTLAAQLSLGAWTPLASAQSASSSGGTQYVPSAGESNTTFCDNTCAAYENQSGSNSQAIFSQVEDQCASYTQAKKGNTFEYVIMALEGAAEGMCLTACISKAAPNQASLMRLENMCQKMALAANVAQTIDSVVMASGGAAKAMAMFSGALGIGLPIMMGAFKSCQSDNIPLGPRAVEWAETGIPAYAPDGPEGHDESCRLDYHWLVWALMQAADTGLGVEVAEAGGTVTVPITQSNYSQYQSMFSYAGGNYVQVGGSFTYDPANANAPVTLNYTNGGQATSWTLTPAMSSSVRQTFPAPSAPAASQGGTTTPGGSTTQGSSTAQSGDDTTPANGGSPVAAASSSDTVTAPSTSALSGIVSQNTIGQAASTAPLGIKVGVTNAGDDGVAAGQAVYSNGNGGFFTGSVYEQVPVDSSLVSLQGGTTVARTPASVASTAQVTPATAPPATATPVQAVINNQTVTLQPTMTDSSGNTWTLQGDATSGYQYTSGSTILPASYAVTQLSPAGSSTANTAASLPFSTPPAIQLQPFQAAPAGSALPSGSPSSYSVGGTTYNYNQTTGTYQDASGHTMNVGTQSLAGTTDTTASLPLSTPPAIQMQPFQAAPAGTALPSGSPPSYTVGGTTYNYNQTTGTYQDTSGNTMNIGTQSLAGATTAPTISAMGAGQTALLNSMPVGSQVGTLADGTAVYTNGANHGFYTMEGQTQVPVDPTTTSMTISPGVGTSPSAISQNLTISAMGPGQTALLNSMPVGSQVGTLADGTPVYTNGANHGFYTMDGQTQVPVDPTTTSMTVDPTVGTTASAMPGLSTGGSSNSASTGKSSGGGGGGGSGCAKSKKTASCVTAATLGVSIATNLVSIISQKATRATACKNIISLLGSEVAIPGSSNGTVASCPTDTMTCPDGSIVGRAMPNCTFEACPNSGTSSGSVAGSSGTGSDGGTASSSGSVASASGSTASSGGSATSSGSATTSSGVPYFPGATAVGSNPVFNGFSGMESGTITAGANSLLTNLSNGTCGSLSTCSTSTTATAASSTTGTTATSNGVHASAATAAWGIVSRAGMERDFAPKAKTLLAGIARRVDSGASAGDLIRGFIPNAPFGVANALASLGDAVQQSGMAHLPGGSVSDFRGGSVGGGMGAAPTAPTWQTFSAAPAAAPGAPTLGVAPAARPRLGRDLYHADEPQKSLFQIVHDRYGQSQARTQ